MQNGTIAKIMDRGYGFISPEDGGEDLFFHASELQDADFNELAEGDPVTFEKTEGKPGPDGEPRKNAVNVSKA